MVMPRSWARQQYTLGAQQFGRSAGQQLPGMLSGMGIGGDKMIKAAAINEGSSGRAEQDAQKWAHLQNDPELLEFVIEQNEYYKTKPAGKKYLRSLLRTRPQITPSALSPDELQQHQARRAAGLLGAMPGGAGLPPELQQKGQQLLTPYMGAQEFPVQRWAPRTARTPEEQGQFWKRFTGAAPPATREEAAGARVRGEVFPEVPTNYNEWIEGKERRFEEIPDTEQGLAGFLTMGNIALQNLPPGVEFDIYTKWPELTKDTALLTKLGIVRDAKGDPDFKNWDNAAFEAKGWEEKLNAYLHLITALDLDEKTRQWIFFNWFGGGIMEPPRLTRSPLASFMGGGARTRRMA